MARFTDTRKRTWQVDLSIADVRRIRDATDVDLLAVFEDGSILERLATDPITLVDVLFVACSVQAEKEGISDEDFGRGLAGDAIDDATRALLEAIVDFFPNARRAILRQIVDRILAADERATGKIQQAIEDGALDRMIDQATAEVDRHLAELQSSGS